MIVGFPSETKEDIRESVAFIRRNSRFIHDIKINKFGLTYGSPIYLNPHRYGVTNLTPNESRFYSAFDESGGLKWEQKQQQQEESHRQIVRAKHRNLGIRPFVFYRLAFFKLIINKIKIMLFKLIITIYSIR